MAMFPFSLLFPEPAPKHAAPGCYQPPASTTSSYSMWRSLFGKWENKGRW